MYELLETGTGQPAALAGNEQGSKPPLDRTSEDGSHVILTWDPVDIQANSTVNFGVQLQDVAGNPLQDVAYNFVVKDANGTIIQEFDDQQAPSGNATQQVTFNSTGPMTVSVMRTSVGGMTTGQLVQSADFNIVVVPEFSVSTTIVAVVAVVIGLIAIIMTRTRSSNLGSLLFGAKGPS